MKQTCPAGSGFSCTGSSWARFVKLAPLLWMPPPLLWDNVALAVTPGCLEVSRPGAFRVFRKNQLLKYEAGRRETGTETAPDRENGRSGARGDRDDRDARRPHPPPVSASMPLSARRPVGTSLWRKPRRAPRGAGRGGNKCARLRVCELPADERKKTMNLQWPFVPSLNRAPLDCFARRCTA